MAETIKISELVTADISLSDFLVKADVNGVATKNTIQNLATLISTTGDVAFKGSVTILDTPTVDGWWFASESGTYVNFNNEVVDLSNGISILTSINSVSEFNQIVIPSIQIDNAIIEGSNGVVNGGAIYSSREKTKEIVSTGYAFEGNLINQQETFFKYIESIWVEDADGVARYVNIANYASNTLQPDLFQFQIIYPENRSTLKTFYYGLNSFVTGAELSYTSGNVTVYIRVKDTPDSDIPLTTCNIPLLPNVVYLDPRLAKKSTVTELGNNVDSLKLKEEGLVNIDLNYSNSDNFRALFDNIYVITKDVVILPHIFYLSVNTYSAGNVNFWIKWGASAENTIQLNVAVSDFIKGNIVEVLGTPSDWKMYVKPKVSNPSDLALETLHIDLSDNVFKPNAIEFINETIDIITPPKIYTVSNDIRDVIEDSRNYTANLYIDHLLKLDFYADVELFGIKGDKLPFYSQMESFPSYEFNKGQTVNTTDKNVSLSIDNKVFNQSSVSHVSTLSSIGSSEFPKILFLGDSVTEGTGSGYNMPYPTAPRQFWNWVQSYFNMDKAEKGSGHDCLSIGNTTALKKEWDILDFPNSDDISGNYGFCMGRGGSKLSEWLKEATVSGGAHDNPFYDATISGSNKFSINKFLDVYKTLADDGVTRLVVGSTAGTAITTTSALNATDVCTPTHIVVQLGYNDVELGYKDNMTGLIARIQAEHPNMNIILSLPDTAGTYFPKNYPEFIGDYDNDQYPNNLLYGTAKSTHEKFYNMNKVLMEIESEDVTGKVFYAPTYFISPTAYAMPFRQIQDGSYLSSKALTHVNYTSMGSASYLHPNNIAHASWGYQIYSLIKYTLSL